MIRLYRLLLHLYPAAFRADYADEMAAIFRARRREASGRLAWLALWLEAFHEVVMNAPGICCDRTSATRYARFDVRPVSR